MIIQQVTKGGTFVGSNKIKHMTTAMGHLKFDSDGQRFFHFSKNRRGGSGNKLFFNLNSKNKVNWLFDEPDKHDSIMYILIYIVIGSALTSLWDWLLFGTKNQFSII